MNRLQHLRLLADYNRWMNDKLYAAAARLAEDDLMRDTGAFFGSLFDTLNHIVVGDTLWLKRFARHPDGLPALAGLDGLPQPQALNERQCATLLELRKGRAELDALISAMTAQLTEAHLDRALAYHNTRGLAQCKPFHGLLAHFFNHQTHHRGQASTLLSQFGEDLGVTDLIALIEDVPG